MEDLARVVDPRALDGFSGAFARIEVHVPAVWCGRLVAITAPARVTCARCDGGGCDGCDRRGGFRLEGDPAVRTFTTTLPERLVDGVSLRLASPFDGAAPIELLRVDVRVADGPSPGARLLEAPVRPSSRNPVAMGVAIAAGIAAIVLAALLSR